MGFLRKTVRVATRVTTGGLTGGPINAYSKKERIMRAAEGRNTRKRSATPPPRPAAKTPAAPAPVRRPSSVADELAKLAGLHASGALTDDEFAAAKARLLGTQPASPGDTSAQASTPTSSEPSTPGS